MSQKHNLKAFINFFYFTGLSIKAFDRKKSLMKNWKTFWSFLMILFFSVIVIFFFYVLNLAPKTSRVQVFLFISFFSYCLCTLITFLLTILKRDAEKKFWKLAENAEEIFENMNLEKSVLSKQKIFIIIFTTISAQTLTICSAIYYKNFVTVRITLMSLPAAIVGRIFGMKFIFFVDVLHFYLDKIRQKLSQDKITISEMKSLMRAFTLCWKMCRGIEDIFGWGMAYYTFMTFITYLSNGNALCIDIVKSNFNIGPFFFLITNTIAILVITSSCQNCYKCTSRIASLIFRKNFQDNKGIVEAFALQLKHQRISFEPKSFFVISYKNYVNVRKSAISYAVKKHKIITFFISGHFNNFTLLRDFDAISFIVSLCFISVLMERSATGYFNKFRRL